MKGDIANKVYKGKATIRIPVNKKYVFQSDGKAKIYDDNGFELNPIGKSPGTIHVEATDSEFWLMDYQDKKRTFTTADSTPVEVNIENPPDIMTRMKALIQAEIMNKYGADADEVETLEEALDFDIDGDGEIGFSAAEIAAMPDEELLDLGLVRTDDPESLEPAPAEPEVEPPTPPAEETPPA
jgi:hypothetical protein